MEARPTELTENAVNHNFTQRWRAFLPISLVTIMVTLDSSVVNVSLPVISQQLGADIGLVEWVVLAYLLTITGLLMISGRLGDLRGRRGIYLTGIILFIAASALCGFAVNIAMLIVSRALQGIGAALILANGPALITEIFPAEHRGKALGLMGTMVSVGLSTGPALGGFITSWLGWRYIFYLNLPLGIIAAIMVRRFLRADGELKNRPFDLVGSSTMALGVFCLLMFLSRGTAWGWISPPSLVLMVAAGILLTIFIRWEARTSDPVLDLKLFNNPIFRSATLSGYLAFVSLFAQTFLLPFYLIQLRELAPAHAGLFLMAVPLTMSVVAPTSGSLSDRIGTKGLCIIGLILQGIAFLLLATLRATTPESMIVASLLVLGLGTGMFNSPNNSELLGSVPRHRLGNASSMLSLSRNLGMVTGIALSGAVFNGVRNHLSAGGGSHASVVAALPFLGGLHWAFWVAAGVAWTAALIVWRRPRPAERTG